MICTRMTGRHLLNAAEAYTAVGFELIEEITEKEWTGGLFRKKAE